MDSVISPVRDDISIDTPVFAALRISPPEANDVARTSPPLTPVVGAFKTYSHRTKKPIHDTTTNTQVAEVVPATASPTSLAEASHQGEAERDGTVVERDGLTPSSQRRIDPPPMSPKTAFLAKVTKPVGVMMPPPPAPKRRKKTLPSDFKPRRSRQVARLSPESNTLAATAVCRQLGFTEGGNKVSAESLEQYSKVFEQPLSQSHLRALAALFGFEAPPDAEVRSVSDPSV